MLQADPKIDPLVEILRLAYRRGLAIRQEQSQGQPVNGQEVDVETENLGNEGIKKMKTTKIKTLQDELINDAKGQEGGGQ